MGAMTLGEFMDMAEEILDEHPEAADFPMRVRGMVVTDLYLEPWKDDDGKSLEGEIELVTMLPHEVDDTED